ncbi:hypothetical protein F0562_008892 [Nyssa sinensis]|uniref:DUF4220 domain-containing protein n=1 Tax=Nyssa sinensis TaxID=561372 RepID=A0A5J5A9A8_9ASTE|nr:hypothetical protein F0562_008892 [Nyssa sinensis]
MLNLLVMRPTMISAVVGIGQIRLWIACEDTCAQAKHFFGSDLLGRKNFLRWEERWGAREKLINQEESFQQQRRLIRRKTRKRRTSCTGAKKENQKSNMTFPIPKKAKKLWDQWNVRIAVLISLIFQIVLIFSATSRKRTGSRIVNLVIWSAYLLADWVAAFAVGLISNGQGNDCDKLKLNEDLAAFWAPFLLLHLGGPDTITAFSLEDNELWLRHLLGLVIQLIAVAYVFSQ